MYGSQFLCFIVPHDCPEALRLSLVKEKIDHRRVRTQDYVGNFCTARNRCELISLPVQSA